MELFDWLQNPDELTAFFLGIGGIVAVSFIAAVVSRVMRHSSATRHSVLLSGLTACFMAPIVALVVCVSGHPLFGLQCDEVLRVAGNHPVVAGKIYESELENLEIPPDVNDADLGQSSVTAAAPTVPASIAPGSRSMHSESQPRPSVFGLFWTTWLVGTVVLSLFAARAFFRVQRIRECATVSDSEDLQDVAARAANRVGLLTLPRLLQSDAIRAPAVVGFGSTEVMFPVRVLETVTRSELTDILTHEFAHVRRGDPWIVLLQTAARCLFWPVVTVHWLNRELSRAREEVCDNYVLNHSRSASYGRTLLKLAELAVGTRSLPTSVGMLNWQGKVEKRIRGLLDDRRNSRTSVGVSKRILTLVAFLGLSAVVCGTRYVEADSSNVSQPTAEGPDEPAEDNVKRQPDPANASHFQMTVQDADGKPASGAKVVLWQVAYRSGSRSVPVEYQTGFTTGDDGSVVIPYPKQTGVRNNDTLRLGLRIEYPDAPTWSGYRAIDDASPFNLARAIRVSVTARTASGKPESSDIYAVTNGRWVGWTNESGTLRSGALDISGNRPANLLRIVYGPENGPVLFSDLFDLSELPQHDNAITIDAVLKPSARVVGELSENVPRPVKNGKVIGSIQTSGSVPFGGWRWQVVADVGRDGSFVLDGLPAHDTLQLIAVCDGWVSLPPRPSEVDAYSKRYDFEVRHNHAVTTGRVTPQLHYVSDGSSETTVTMHQTGNVKVKVVDWDDKPVAGATVSFSPNQAWHNGGSTILGIGNSTLEYLRRPTSLEQHKAKALQRHDSIRAKYIAVTDEEGEATVRDLPAHRMVFIHRDEEKEGPPFVGFHVSHQDYVLVPKEPQRIFSEADTQESVDLIPGQTVTIRVRMDRKDKPKDIQVSDAATELSKRGTTAHAKAPASARSEDSDKADSIPIDVSGKVTTHDGQVIAGVKVHLVSMNGLEKKLGVTETASDGTYRFEEIAMPIRRRRGSIAQGTIEVFAVVDGYGLAWHGMRSVLSTERPSSDPLDRQQTCFYKGEPISMDLVLPPRASLTGQVRDDRGKPISDAHIQLSTLDYLDTEGRVYHPNYREFRGLQFAPAELQTAKTGPDGQFRIDNLPAETAGVVRISHSNYADQSVVVAITDRDISEYRYVSNSMITVVNGKMQRKPVYETRNVTIGPLAVTVAPNRQVDIHVTDADGKPLKNVFVTAVSVKPRTSAAGRSDDYGKLRLALPPGDYRLTATPTRDTNFVRTHKEVTVADDDTPKVALTMQTGCILFLKAIDADTGQPIQGVSFWREMDDKPGARTGMITVPYFVDHPVSDENGELRALVDPGTRSYGVGWSPLPKPYRGGGGPGRQIACEPRKTVRVTFELRKGK